MKEWIPPVLESATATLINLLPYVVAGVVVSEILKYITWGKLLVRYASVKPTRAVIWAVGIGIVSPMCTYGSLPIILILFNMGFPVSSLISFLVASSLMNPQLFIITWGGISPMMAVLRLVSVILFALVFGFVLQRIDSHWIVNPNLKHKNPSILTEQKLFAWREFIKSSLHTLQFVGFYIVIGVLLGAVIDVLIPEDRIFHLFQKPEWLGILISALLGIPLYVCGGGTVPLINAMLAKGLSAGAALAFFIVGPATRITPLVALTTIMRPRFIIFMVLLLLLFATGMGFLINGII